MVYILLLLAFANIRGLKRLQKHDVDLCIAKQFAEKRPRREIFCIQKHHRNSK